jgi:hypothetical protein
MTNESLDELRVNLSVKSKNGLDFTLSAITYPKFRTVI